MRDQDFPHRRYLLQSRGGIDRMPQRGELAGFAHATQKNRSRVHPNPDCQRRSLLDHPPRPAVCLRVAYHFLNCQRRPDGLLWIIFTRPLYTPQRHHGIANVLINLAAALQDDLINLPPQGVDQIADILGIQALADRRKTRYVREKHRHLLALFLDQCRGRLQRCQLLA